GLHDCLDALAKAWAGQVLVDNLHFRLLALGCLAGHGQLHERLADSCRHWNSHTWVRNPHVIDKVESLDVLWQYLADDDGDLRFSRPLIAAKFCRPAVAPVLRPLRFPQDGAACLA